MKAPDFDRAPGSVTRRFEEVAMDKSKRTTQKCVSRDGSLTFVVVREGGDVSVGFDWTPWHTHADIGRCFRPFAGKRSFSVRGIAAEERTCRSHSNRKRSNTRRMGVTDHPAKEDAHKR